MKRGRSLVEWRATACSMPPTTTSGAEGAAGGTKGAGEAVARGTGRGTRRRSRCKRTGRCAGLQKEVRRAGKTTGRTPGAHTDQTGTHHDATRPHPRLKELKRTSSSRGTASKQRLIIMVSIGLYPLPGRCKKND